MVERENLKQAFLRTVRAVENFKLEDPLVGLVEQKLGELPIRGLLWDLDDHLLDTSNFIHKYLAAFVEEVAARVGRGYDETWALMKKHSDVAWGIYHVNPIRWRFVIEQMSRELGCAVSLLEEPHDRLLELYGKSPDFIPGAPTMLRLAKVRLGLKIVVVTNVNKGWNDAKRAEHNLDDYVDEFVVADENRPKGVSDWWAGVTLSGLPPEMLLGGGDSIEGDFIPLKQIGVRGIIGVPPLHPQAKNGHQPEGVTMVGSIAEWAEGVLRL